MRDVQYLPLDVEAMEQARAFSADACSECVGLTELCPACQDLRDVRDSANAQLIVDETDAYYISTFRGTVLRAVPDKPVASGGSVAEPRPLSITRDAESGHDWVGSVTKLIRPAIQIDGSIVEDRYEFTDPISLIADRLFDLETSLTVTANETVCEDCHYLYNKAIACPNCN
jgi:RNA polymerase subunit RPABC4/transcription elongation factor Spt4